MTHCKEIVSSLESVFSEIKGEPIDRDLVFLEVWKTCVVENTTTASLPLVVKLVTLLRINSIERKSNKSHYKLADGRRTLKNIFSFQNNDRIRKPEGIPLRLYTSNIDQAFTHS